MATSLRMIDRDGLASFSMPRLGDEMRVRPPSLYHHFRDKAEILSEVARAVVLETELPPRPVDGQWMGWFVELAVDFRNTILRHRNAAPVLLQFLPRDIMVTLYEYAASILNNDSSVPVAAHVLLLDGLEKITIGTALIEAMKAPENRSKIFPNADPSGQPILSHAVDANPWSTDEMFAESVRAFLVGVVATQASHQG